MIRLKKIYMAAAIVSVLSLEAVSCTLVDTPAGTQNLRGILEKVDNVTGDMTVILNDGTTATINLKDIKVETIGKTPGNASLEIGSEVTVNQDNSGKIIGLRVHNAEVEGVIASLDPAKFKVTITLNEKSQQLTINVTNKTVILIGGNVSATFTDLRTGQRLEARYHVESKNALQINVDREDGRIKGEVRGRIALIDRAARTITVRSESGTETTPLKVTPATRFWFDKAGTFEGLYAGMEVKVKYNSLTGELIRLEGKDPRSPVEKFLDKNS